MADPLLYDEDEEARRWAQEILGGSDEAPQGSGAVLLPDDAPPPVELDEPAVAEPQAQPAQREPRAARTDDVFAGLGGFGGLGELASRQRPAVNVDVPAPPPRAESPNTALLIGAGLLDLALNKGRNAGAIIGSIASGDQTDYQNYQREMQHAKDTAGLQALAQRGTGRASGQITPRDVLNARLRQRGLDQADERLELLRGVEGRRRAQFDIEHSPEEAQRFRQYLIDGGIDPELVNGMSLRELKQVQSNLNKRMEHTPEMISGAARLAGAKAGASSAATVDDRIRVAREGASARAQAEWASPQMQHTLEKDYRAAAVGYAHDTKFVRDASRFLSTAERIAEKYSGKDIPGAGMVDSARPTVELAMKAEQGSEWHKDAIDIRYAQKWMGDIVQRFHSGAAAPENEAQGFAIRTGAKAGATEQEFLAGLRAASEWAKGNLSANAAGREEAARDVLSRSGIDPDWAFSIGLPGAVQGGKQQPPARRKPTASPESVQESQQFTDGVRERFPGATVPANAPTPKVKPAQRAPAAKPKAKAQPFDDSDLGVVYE